LDLGTAHPQPTAIRAAVQEVLTDPSYRAAAQALAAQMAAAGGAAEAVRRINLVLDKQRLAADQVMPANN
jgi:UDP:flavonoid glycosyltransferase YjiC (YdhE family)